MDADANNPHYLTTAKYIGKNKKLKPMHYWFFITIKILQ